MPSKKPNGRQRRRFLRALVAAVSVGGWTDTDYPITVTLERHYRYGQRWRTAKRDWGWEPTDTWSIEISAAGNADFLEGYQTIKINRDQKTGEITSALYGESVFIARLGEIGKAAWDAGIRTIKATLEEKPNGHEQLELAAEAEHWLATPVSK